MKPLFLFLCVLSLTSYSSFAMDFNAEDGIPLEGIYQRTTAKEIYQTITEGLTASTHTKTEKVPQISIVSKREQFEIKKPIISLSVDERFSVFEQKMLDEFGGLGQPVKKSLSSDLYLKLAQKNIPEMFADTETIKKCAHIENTFFINVIDKYEDIMLHHYARVTSDTLATINDPNVKQSIEEFNEHPLALKKYIMDRAYQSVKAISYTCIEFPDNCRCIAFHGITQLAVVATDKEFQVWDPKTGKHSILPKKAHKGGTIFSEDGKQFITVTMHQEKPTEIIHIDIWDSITKKQTHTIAYRSAIKQVILQNTSTEDKMLILFDTYNNLAIYNIQKDASPTYLMGVRTKIKEFDILGSNDGKYGNYELSGRKLSRKRIAYAFCKQAIKNTIDKESLQKVRSVDFYQRLTLVEQNLIEQAIIQKTQELMQNKKKDHTVFKSLFG